MTKAPLGGEKTGKNPTDRAKSGVKRSLMTDGRGVPLAVAVAGANCHDKNLVKLTLQSLACERPAPTRFRPQHMCMDKGYDYARLLQFAASWEAEPLEFAGNLRVFCRAEPFL